jgi:glycosyltransferase involved in cell wall biosynthesis
VVKRLPPLIIICTPASESTIGKKQMAKPINVLHIDSSNIWGGGQSQITTLIQESKHFELAHHLASPKDSKLYFKTRAQIAGYVPLHRLSIISPIQFIRMRSYCIKNKIDIIHAHCGKSHAFAYWLKRIFLPSIILVVHRRIPAKLRPNLLSRKKFLDLTVNHFICVSNFIKGVLMSSGVDESRLSVIRSSKKIFSSNPEEKNNARNALLRSRGLARDGSFLILSASRLVPDKGLFILIQAFRKLVRQFPGARLFIAGEGELESELKIAARSLIDSGVVVFLGFRKDVPELLLGSDVFAIPSLSEGLGSTIVEAMFARTAVIGSAVEGIPELICQESTGLLVPPGDAEALSLAFLRLANDAGLRNNIANSGNEWALKACGAEGMVKKTFEVYQALAEGVSPTNP